MASQTHASMNTSSLEEMNSLLSGEVKPDGGSIVVPVIGGDVIDGIGKYMVPKINSLINHYRLVYDRNNELDFWGPQNPSFDSIIEQTFFAPAFSKPEHPHYFNYEPLRDNIATVRNYLYDQIVDGVDMSDSRARFACVKKLEQMGREIGVALERDSLTRRPGSLHLDVLEASQPGVGAAKMYELLCKKQDRSPLLRPLDMLLGRQYWNWGLPKLENSPFSKENVDAFCLAEEQNLVVPSEKPDVPAEPPTPAQPDIQPQPEPEPQPDSPAFSRGHELSVLGAALAGSAFSLDRVEQLPRPVKHRAIEIARDILDKLKINLCDDTLNKWLDHPKEETLDYAKSLAQVGELYANSHEIATLANPELKQDPAILAANAAMGKLAYMIKQQAASALEAEGNVDDAQMLRGELASFPSEWQQVDGVTVDQLLGDLQTGLECAHGAAVSAQHEWQQNQARLTEKSSNTPRPRAQTEAQMKEAAKALAASVATGHKRGEKTPDMQDILAKGISADELQTMKEIGVAGADMNPDEVQRRRSRSAVRTTQQRHAQHENFCDALQAQKDACPSLKR